MKNRCYWKVVRVVGGDYFSRVISKGKYKIHYRIGEIAKSRIPESGIFCFSTRQQARKYNKNVENTAVLKVIPTGEQITMPAVYNYWDIECGYKNGYNVFNTFLPSGTVCFSEIKVIEKSR